MDKTELLASERLEPYTAAEQAQAEGHQDEYARDVPRTCICPHRWQRAARSIPGRYVIISQAAGCPWHSGGEGTDGI